MGAKPARRLARRLTAAGAAVAMLAAAFAATPAALAQGTAAGATGQKTARTAAKSTATQQASGSDVIAIAFQNNWNSVAAECTQTYGPEGVGYVQVSPPNETIKGTPWWTSYQPVSYKLDSKLGTEAEFRNMIKVCNAAGVRIIADAVINHTTGADQGAGTGVAGSAYDGDGDFPAVPYTKENFHSCTKNIGDYTNADEVQNCRLTSLQDLDTSQEYVQDKLAQYMADLLDMGVYGFRVDAVKHIATEDVAAIKAKLAEKTGRDADGIFFEQEVIGNASEAAAIQPGNYVANGKVSEFNFTNHLSVAFNGDIADESTGLKAVGGSGWVDSDKAAVWVTNWDTERGSALTYKKGSKYLLANAFMLAYDYGQPHIYSGYYFENNDDGAPGATDTSVPDVTCPTDGSMTAGTWQCAQRWTAIRGMIGFHNAVSGTKVTDWKTYGSNIVGFGRGAKGYLALNNSDKDAELTFSTSLPAGEYCNVYATGDCSQTVTVGADGTFTATLGKHNAIALYAGATKGEWTGTNATDPTDPDLGVNDASKQAATDTSRTIYYRLPEGWTQAYLHYGIGENWATQGHELMQDAGDGWVKLTVDPAGEAFEYVFTDGGSNWDNPAGGGNYTAKGHWTAVADHEAKSGIPEALQGDYQPKTRVIVHYKPAVDDADADSRGVYLWGTDKDGATLDGQWHTFTGNDAYGKVFDLTVDGAYDAGKIGVIVTTEGWNKVGGDRMIDGSNGTAEIWVDGSQPDTTLTAAPEGHAKQADRIDVTIHYHRTNDDYASEDGLKAWDIWGWADGVNGAAHPFTTHDDYGLTATYTLTGSGLTKPQFIVRYGGDAWEAKDPDGNDRTIPQSAITMNADGTARAEIWLVQGDATVYTNGTLFSAKGAITSAEMTDFTTITAKLNKTIDASTLPGAVTLEGAKVKSVKADGATVTITVDGELDVTKTYTLAIDGYGTKRVSVGALVRTDAFDKKYAYDGDDLGATWTKEKTTFKLWAPTATSVTLRAYKSTDPSSGVVSVRQSLAASGDKGVWTFAVDGDLSGYAYDYELSFADGTVNVSADPYATAAVANGARSVVLSDAQRGSAGKRMASFSSPTDAVITEANVRDMTISPTSGVSEKNRGKYLGFVEEGATVNGETGKDATPSGVDYLKSLGVTHVQIMPVYDFGSVDETGDLSYNAPGSQNWGYDPVNYNVPEGSYSSDPTDPSARVKEMKQMVEGLHSNGLYVVMDVVYNHVYNASTHAFNQTVPGYYFRYDANGNLLSNSGCGNDVASERAMARKYIVDSVKYWATQYNVDGFRFDLMGLLDQTTMKQVRAALDEIDPGILVIGEGWDMTDALGDQETTQAHAANVKGVAFFNDSIRDAIKGSVFSDADTGFITGKAGQEGLIASNMLACPNGRSGIGDAARCGNADYADAGQVVQYVEIHDNLTLYDKLVKSAPNDSEETRLARAKLADAIILLSQGVTDMQFGQEFLRTKGGDGNSYNAGDAVNAVDWNRVVEQADSVDYVRGLITLRKAIGALHLSDYADIAANMTVIAQSDGVVAYRLTSGKDTYVVALNANGSAARVTGVDAGEYTVLAADGKVLGAGAAAGAAGASAGAATTLTVGEDGLEAGALSATVLKAGVSDGGSDGGSGDGDKGDGDGSGSENGSGDTGDADKDDSGKKPSNGKPGADGKADGLSKTGASVAVVAGVAVLAVALAAVGLALRRRKA
ncbi:type I pullulanase [Bifidobacterium aesculapii]|uniref:type I pullulanase n=1 Tax=Bifidobacterium aesculapii TaxID=1329411 RepID=UPI0006E32F59|nr:type I pullulanase [Bifidobacterium aesculapii]